jgi:hypothetical protein
MTIHNTTTTTNYVVQWDDGDPNGQSQAMATAIAGICESEHTVLTGWFDITTGFGTSDRITVTVQSISAGGANNFGYSSGGNSVINVNFLPAGFTAAQADEIAKMMFVAELVEIFMDFNNQKSGTTTWVAGHSDGEGLSQICSIMRFPTGHYDAYNSWVNSWLSSPRANFVSSNESTDGNPVSFGCALLFLYYLRDQLGFTIQQIIQHGGATLVDLYKNLTGDNNDPFNYFLSVVNSKLPSTTTLPETGTEQADDPFPIFSLTFWDGKNTYGKSEVQDSITNVKPFQDALLLVLEGFSPTHWQGLGSPVPADPSGDAANFPGIHFNRTHVEFENTSLPLVPQRIHFHYDVSFDNTSIAAFTTASQVKELDSSITISGSTANASTDFEFLGAENPYFSNVKPGVDNVPWLSDDLRVFTAIPSFVPVPVPGGPTFSTDNIDGARSYLAALLTYLNQHYTDATLTDPFDHASNVIPEQQDAFAGDSSVIPNLSFLGQNFNTYNFAIARVRMRGPIGDSSSPVKVFFRMWQSQSPDTDFQPGNTYNSHLDALNLPDWPLPAPDSSTFPFFATSNTPNFTDPNNTEFGNGGINNQPITVNSSAGAWHYFGCLLNVYDASYIVNGTPVTQLLPGTHHCLVAEIAYDDAPILSTAGVTVSPGNSDKLAQRNLQISQGFNPGVPPTNRVPQTFDIRRSTAGNSDFDELMIDWGSLPIGTIASIYWPQVNASQVILLASQRYGHHELSASDAHTIQCKVTRRLSYVPIPPGAGEKFAGLLTVDLPQTVTKGQSFTVVAKRVTSYTPPPPVVINAPGLQAPEVRVRGKHLATHKRGKPPEQPQKPRSWRYITGAFQINIPIQADADILPFDMNTLAIFKWRLSVMPLTNRWYPVMKRYIDILSARIDGLGGDAGSILPSPTGLPAPVGKPGKHHHKEYTGKICEILYDCFGDFEGFKLCTCSEERTFASREKGIEHIALNACRERHRVSVIVDDGRIVKVILRC